jgi:hypothetical protein
MECMEGDTEPGYRSAEVLASSDQRNHTLTSPQTTHAEGIVPDMPVILSPQVTFSAVLAQVFQL